MQSGTERSLCVLLKHDAQNFGQGLKEIGQGVKERSQERREARRENIKELGNDVRNLFH